MVNCVRRMKSHMRKNREAEKGFVGFVIIMQLAKCVTADIVVIFARERRTRRRIYSLVFMLRQGMSDGNVWERRMKKGKKTFSSCCELNDTNLYLFVVFILQQGIM